MIDPLNRFGVVMRRGYLRRHSCAGRSLHDVLGLFRIAVPHFSQPVPSTWDLGAFFSDTYPATGADLAKALFWSFVAGFSERLVPQLLDEIQAKERKSVIVDIHSK